MAAPALVALAHGSRDPRSAATIKALVDEVRAMRPDLRIEQAFLELSKPSFTTVVDRLVQGRPRRDRRRPAAAHRGLPREGRRARGRRRGDRRATRACRSAATSILGLETQLPRGARPADARGAQGARGCASSTRWCWPPPAPPTRSPTRPSPGWPGSGAPTTSCRSPRRSPRPPRRPPARPSGRSAREGRRHIAVASLFLAPGFLPDRAAELALEAGAVAVSEPLGAHPELARTILARYAVGAVELVPV